MTPYVMEEWIALALPWYGAIRSFDPVRARMYEVQSGIAFFLGIEKRYGSFLPGSLRSVIGMEWLQ